MIALTFTISHRYRAYVMDNDPYQSRRFRAVLFDYFGTLTTAVQRGPAHRRIARMLNCDPDAWVALLDRTFYLRAAGQLGEPVETLRLLAGMLGARPRHDALYMAFAARITAVAQDGPLRPEAVPVLRAIRARGLRTAVVSDCWYELPRVLPSLPVYPLLDARVYSVAVGCCKPDPKIYLAACAELGVAPEECLYVGDGGSNELTGAADLGMTAVRLAAPDLAGHLSFSPDARWAGPAVPGLPAIVDLLDRIPALAA